MAARTNLSPALSLACLALLLVTSACGQTAAHSEHEPVAYQLDVTEAPFSYRLVVDGRPVVAQRAPNEARSSLYFVTEDGVQHLAEPMSVEADERTFEGTYTTTDDRQARVRITPQPHGGVQVGVTVEPADGILRVGEVLAAGPDEHFHGLTERVTGNTDGVARDPDVPVALDRRGEVVEMWVEATISAYTPFYLSSSGYGLYVEGTWRPTPASPAAR